MRADDTKGRKTRGIANDNGRRGTVVVLKARRDAKVRRDSVEREWTPAILATFFTADRLRR
jgi:hypothetical protein